MREKRGQLFNRNRFGLEINSKNVQDTLTEIVRKELNNLATTDLNPILNPFFVNEPLDPEEAIELEAKILDEEGKIIEFVLFIYCITFIYNLLYRTMDIRRI